VENLDKTEELSRRRVGARAGQAWAAWYWAVREGKPQAERVAAILAHRFYRKWAAVGPFVDERDDRGNRMYRDEDADLKLALPEGTSRYAYDFEPSWFGRWQQFDTKQDASYFGVWVDVEGMRTFKRQEAAQSTPNNQRARRSRAPTRLVHAPFTSPQTPAALWTEH
jgi:hypothetical protein